MPTNKPMKMQWLNIDGRQVPSILPNHWNEQKNDWDITGTKNPLPVANYTQNASGVWLPISKDNPVPTQLTGSKVEKVILVNAETVSAGGIKSVDFDYKGEKYRYLAISIDKAPWSIRSNTIYRGSSDYPSVESCLFPRAETEYTTGFTTIRPKEFIYTGRPITAGSFGDPQTIQEAIESSLPIENAQVRITNLSDTSATLTVQLIRVWGV